MKQNNFGLHIHMIQPLPGLDMQAKPPTQKVGAIGVKGPWNLNPGNPDFPNHRPYLTNPKPPNQAISVPPQKLKF